MDPAEENSGELSPGASSTDSDLKFVSLVWGEDLAGGWYRELPNSQIEVLSRAELQRVPLTGTDAETTARRTIEEMLGRKYSPAPRIGKQSED